MSLLPDGARVEGRLDFDGRPVAELDVKDLRRYRADDVAMIYQDPRAHMNPLRTIGSFLLEGPLERTKAKADAVARVVKTLKEVGIDDAERRLHQYPHQLSGGLLQRVMIAAALVAEPRLILADEPTTALDVTTQQEVIAILAEQCRDRELAMVLITHDLDLAAAVADRIAVMYAGVIVEDAPAESLYGGPRHPYTAGLLASRPHLDRAARLQTIPGRPVSAYEAGPGCVFASRCPFVEEEAKVVRPRPRELDGHIVACHRAEDLREELRTRSEEATSA